MTKGQDGYHGKRDQMVIMANGTDGYVKRNQMVIMAKGTRWLSWQKEQMVIMAKGPDACHGKR